MNRKLSILALLLAFTLSAPAQEKKNEPRTFTMPAKIDLPEDEQAIREAADGWWKESMENYDERVKWYKDARFGCFVHWGVYSTAGDVWNGKASGGYSEHLMRKAMIPLKTYKDSLVYTFNPVDFDAEKWMSMVEATGMKYFIITAKHHDGFAMYPSDAYPYDIRLTKYKGDPMMELREAAKRHGIKFGFYYSHAFDWEHPLAPGNDWEYEHPGGDRHLGGEDWWNGGFKWFIPYTEKYVEEKSLPQIKELIARYHPDIMWFDTPHKLPDYLNIRILKELRECDPDNSIVVNGRLITKISDMGDYINTGDKPANFFPVAADIWEAVPTTNESYGYNAADNSHKSIGHFVQLIETAVSKGGNILLNIGPMGNGKMDERDLKIFRGIGSWMQIYGESIYGTGRSELPLLSRGVVTQKHDTVYLHIRQWPEDGKIMVGGLHASVKKMWVPGQEKARLKYRQRYREDGYVRARGVEPDSISTVVAMVLKEGYRTNPVRVIDPSIDNVLMTFDSELRGDGLGYAGGRKNQDFIKGWNNNDQSMCWEFRTASNGTFDFSLNYATGRDNEEGDLELVIDGQAVPFHYSGFVAKDGRPTTLPVGTLRLKRGKHTCELRGVSTTGSAYPRPYAVVVNKHGK